MKWKGLTGRGGGEGVEEQVAREARCGAQMMICCIWVGLRRRGEGREGGRREEPHVPLEDAQIRANV